MILPFASNLIDSAGRGNLKITLSRARRTRPSYDNHVIRKLVPSLKPEIDFMLFMTVVVRGRDPTTK